MILIFGQIKKVDCDFNFCSARTKSEFFYWDFTDGRYEDSHLIDYLTKKLIYFCLSKKEISETIQKAKTHEEIYGLMNQYFQSLQFFSRMTVFQETVNKHSKNL